MQSQKNKIKLEYDFDATPPPSSLTGQIKLSSMTHLHPFQSMQPLYTLHSVHLIMKYVPQRWWVGNNLPSIRGRVTLSLTGKSGRFKCKRVAVEEKVKPVKHVEVFPFCDKCAAGCRSECCGFMKDDMLLGVLYEEYKTYPKHCFIWYFWTHLHAVSAWESCSVKNFSPCWDKNSTL